MEARKRTLSEPRWVLTREIQLSQAALILGVQFRAVAVDDDYVLKGDALRSAIEEDVAKGLKPFFVIATVGTTSTGAVDRIAEIGAVGE